MRGGLFQMRIGRDPNVKYSLQLGFTLAASCSQAFTNDRPKHQARH